ncbi:hypothetical protein JXA84_06745 [candidate division WOR-3 bacterium]|nr:hypothetical protein [candidate division WOR-3 bacterium]
MAIRVVPLKCPKCENVLKAKQNDKVFICPKCLIAFEPRESTDETFEIFSSSTESSSIFLPYFLLSATIVEKHIEVTGFDNFAEFDASEYFDVHNNDKTGRDEEILMSAAKKLAEAKIPKKPYSVSTIVPAFNSKNAIQYGMDFGRIFFDLPEFEKKYIEPSLPTQMSSQGAVLMSKNLLLNWRAKENSYILSIDFDQIIDKISLLILGFEEKGGILENNRTALKIPKVTLKEVR